MKNLCSKRTIFFLQYPSGWEGQTPPSPPLLRKKVRVQIPLYPSFSPFQKKIRIIPLPPPLAFVNSCSVHRATKTGRFTGARSRHRRKGESRACRGRRRGRPRAAGGPGGGTPDGGGGGQIAFAVVVRECINCCAGDPGLRRGGWMGRKGGSGYPVGIKGSHLSISPHPPPSVV